MPICPSQIQHGLSWDTAWSCRHLHICSIGMNILSKIMAASKQWRGLHLVKWGQGLTCSYCDYCDTKGFGSIPLVWVQEYSQVVDCMQCNCRHFNMVIKVHKKLETFSLSENYQLLNQNFMKPLVPQPLWGIYWMCLCLVECFFVCLSHHKEI